jgi:hypothetical protein
MSTAATAAREDDLARATHAHANPGVVVDAPLPSQA